MEEENKQLGDARRGRLRVFFGFAAGVGKTYGMLAEAHELLLMGKNVVVGYVEPHDRPDTNRLLEGLPQIPPKIIRYKEILLNEPDIDEIIRQKPEIVLIDELAHTNAIGSRNRKRYQDVDELLNAGIDVFTTVNVQHIESLNDIVEEVTGIEVKETVPDTFLQQATIKVIDVEPDELIERLEQGKIYANENAKRALQNFFIPQKLDQLRGLAIQRASDHINRISGKRTGIQNKLLTVVNDTFPKMTEKCIRWTARLAQGLGAEWTVIQVRLQDDTPTNIPLAEKLGAEVISIEEEDSFETIVEFAKMTGVTDIIMGKNLRQPWYEKLFTEAFDDRLLRRLSDTELHLIPFNEEKHSLFFKTRKVIEGGGKDLGIAIGGVFLATIVTELMKYIHVGDQNLMLVYIFFILLVARTTSGYFWSALSSILSVLSFNWFFVAPLYSLTVYKQGYPITLVIMFVVALMISNLMVRLKKQAESAMEKEHQMEILYELNKQYVLAESRQQILDISATYLSRLLEREVIIFDRQAKLESNHRVDQRPSLLDTKDEAAVAFWSAKNQKEAGNGTDTLIGAKGFYLPIVASGKTLAVLGIERNAGLELENDQLNYLKLVLTQIAVILEQTELKDEKEQVELENEREKVRSNLLRAVSHDLRTPLTVISGIAETLGAGNELKEETRKKLLSDIQEESQWLIRMVENLLSITRINMDTMKVTKTAEPVEEIIEAVYKHLKKVYPEGQVAVQLPDDVIFIQADPILIEQALFNLVENAFRHGEKEQPVKLTVYQEQGQTVFEIENHGKIPLKQFQKIQSNLSSANEVSVDSKNGLGIGLSIVKTIIHAHNGKMTIDVKEGKTLVRIYLK
ncbi:sensor histidine kinase [Enterococcus gilvus]|uniref:histidine kinase n=1 Tax=Enterococcus gilvus ATCC BAA-350 TaxID=1158614 RepID=R2VJE0_9ENTE|nr:sensor histidine kinase KdpD [Enterococcus gilvus]EOI57806.1 sensor histidine kinase KdpD [Enterococcus gilvus ATCC BAA-350]EOW79440.1 sensor histidine kinase KdpD [Enterococcus gilvus ATCC BAA-350]OJG44158.1 sensor histidine kinase KdpD [Enterococcus gilvus]